MWNYRSVTPLGLVMGVGLSVNACSLVVDAGREQCVTAADCARLGPDFEDAVCSASLCQPRSDPTWACLDERASGAAVLLPERVRILIPFRDLVTEEPVPGIDVQACGRLDTECLMPVASDIASETGEADLRVPGGFNGYLRWSAPDVYPTMLFFAVAINQDSIIPIDVISPMLAQSLDAQFQDVAIEGSSAIVVNVQNCAGAPAAGVVLSVPGAAPEVRVSYMVDGLFPPGQTETTAAGVARVMNVPHGETVLTGTLANGREIGTTAVLTKPGYVTLTNLGPPLTPQNPSSPF